MFWNSKKKLPITQEDKAWVDECLTWIKSELGEELFMNIRTVTPTKEFYNRTFDKTPEDAIFILNRTMELMGISNKKVNLDFFMDSPIKMDDGTTLSSPADIKGRWSSASGLYRRNEKGTFISIEEGQLENPISLIATIAHELAHVILLEDKRLAENDEFLTDFTAIAYGFGIFLGNSRFSFSSVGEFGWQSSAQGYLPEQVIAYAMARLSMERNENTDYDKFLKKPIRKYFNQSKEWLTENKGNDK